MGIRRSNMHMRKRGGATAYRYLRIVVTNTHGAAYGGFRKIEYSADGGSTWNPTANMTSNSAPSPLVSSANSEYSAAFAAWKAYDGSPTTTWSTVSGASAGALNTIDFGSGNEIAPDRVRLTNYNLSGGISDYSPTEFKVYGSNTGSFGGEEVLLHTETGLSSQAHDAVNTYIF